MVCPGDLSTAEFHNTIYSKVNTSSAELMNDKSESKLYSEIFKTTTNVESRCHREHLEQQPIWSLDVIEKHLVQQSDQ